MKMIPPEHLVVPNTANVSTSFDSQKDSKGGASIKTESLIQIDDLANDRSSNPWNKFGNALIGGDVLVSPREEKEEIQRFADAQLMEKFKT
jgi:hypothetical protein